MELTAEEMLTRLHDACQPDRKLVHDTAHVLFRLSPYEGDEWWARFGLVTGAFAWVDAALMMFDRRFAGRYDFGIHCRHAPGATGFRAHVTNRSRPMPNLGDAPTPALALMIAILKAHIAETPVSASADAKGDR